MMELRLRAGVFEQAFDLGGIAAERAREQQGDVPRASSVPRPIPGPRGSGASPRDDGEVSPVRELGCRRLLDVALRGGDALERLERTEERAVAAGHPPALV